MSRVSVFSSPYLLGFEDIERMLDVLTHETQRLL